MYQFEHNRSPLKINRMIMIFITYFVGYFIVFPFIIVFLSEEVFNTYDYVMQMQFGSYVIVALIVFLLAKPLFIEANQNRFENRRDNFAHAVKSIVIMYGLMFVINITLNLLTKQSSSINQMDIVDMSNNYPVITFMMAVVLAPIIEEIVFRGVIFRSLRNINYPLAIIVSSLLFGLLHVIQSLFTGNYIDLLYGSVYAMLGYYLGLNYERSGNILVPIGMHVTLNFVSMLLLFLARLAG